jgi:hypothetical protein
MWILENRNKRKIEAMGMKFLGSIEGKTRKDSIRNEIIRRVGIQNLLIKLEKKWLK